MYDKLYLNKSEAAKFIGVSRDTFHRLHEDQTTGLYRILVKPPGIERYSVKREELERWWNSFRHSRRDKGRRKGVPHLDGNTPDA
jgi:hypothetical protein